MYKAGFVGLGHMGLPMACNLQKAGIQTLGFDLSAEACARAVAAGVQVAPSLKDLAKDAQVVFTMVPTGDVLMEVLTQVSECMSDQTLFVDCSTIGVDKARQAYEALGSRFLDAPVSGGVGGASEGTLTFIVGGDEANLNRARPFFNAMGNKIIHCGGPGSGQAAKVCNNMLLGISAIGTCEAVAMGHKLGLDPKALYDVLATSTGSCWAVNSYYPVAGVGPNSPADNGFAPGFPAKMMVKDMLLTQKTAAIAEQRTPLGARALELYRHFAEAGGAETDFSGIISHLENLTEENV